MIHWNCPHWKKYFYVKNVNMTIPLNPGFRKGFKLGGRSDHLKENSHKNSFSIQALFSVRGKCFIFPRLERHYFPISWISRPDIFMKQVHPKLRNEKHWRPNCLFLKSVWLNHAMGIESHVYAPTKGKKANKTLSSCSEYDWQERSAMSVVPIRSSFLVFVSPPENPLESTKPRFYVNHSQDGW